MGKLMFGTDEKIECIQDVGVTGSEGEPLCLAYKTRKVFFGAGVWLHDDGYVLRHAKNANTYYPWPDDAQVQKWQSMELLPSPLPKYSVPFIEYAFGYSLWLILLALGGWALFRGWLTKRRHAANALVPVSLGPPKQDTEFDRLISDEAKKHLGDGELLQHQAFAVNEGDHFSAWYLVLTNRNLMVFTTRRGALSPSKEILSASVIDRNAFTSVVEHDYEFTFTHTGGTFIMSVPKRSKHFSNQEAFIRDVPRLMNRSEPALAGVQVLG